MKAKAKSAFTKHRHHLLVLIQDKEVNVEAISKMCDSLDESEQETMDIMLRLSEKHKGEKDSKSCCKLSQEMEQLEIEYSSAQNRAQEVLDRVLGKKPAYQPDEHNSGSHIVKKLEQKQWQSASLNLDQSTVYSRNRGSLSTGHPILRDNQSNILNESDLIGQRPLETVKKGH